MSIEMYIVGTILFSFYMYFTIWNIYRNNNTQKEQRRENQHNSSDPIDMNGMGDFSRFPKDSKTK